MNESAFDMPAPEPTTFRQGPPAAEEPQFGAVDIVEAFTAMRHEWRGQIKESRELAETIQTVVRRIDELEQTRHSQSDELTADASSDAKPLARLIAETDNQLTRAVNAIGQIEEQQQRLEAACQNSIRQYFDAMNPVARWLSRPLLKFCLNQTSRDSAAENSSVQGIRLTLARLRQAMQEQAIERFDVVGLPFDGTTMNAIGTVESTEVPAGYVHEQLAPCYRWKGRILRFADVRVARIPVMKTETEREEK